MSVTLVLVASLPYPPRCHPPFPYHRCIPRCLWLLDAPHMAPHMAPILVSPPLGIIWSSRHGFSWANRDALAPAECPYCLVLGGKAPRDPVMSTSEPGGGETPCFTGFAEIAWPSGLLSFRPRSKRLEERDVGSVQ